MATTAPLPQPRTSFCRAPRIPLWLLLLLLLLPRACSLLTDPTVIPMPAAIVGQLRGPKPAAHVVASPLSLGRGRGAARAGPRWEAGVAPALVLNGVRLQKNRLVVPRDGLYFVYAAAAFQGGPCPAAPVAPTLLRLLVSRLSPEYPRDVPLLRAARSVCRRAGGGPWFESLYQGAVFQLRRGDRLAATASGSRFLDLHGGGGAYFGVLGVD